ncbi:MAG: hypothetical protein WAO76_16675 [Georgfuchsia sp.]
MINNSGDLLLFLALAAVTLVSACTSEQAYNSIKGWQKNECNRRVDNRDREQCLLDADTSYDEYKKQMSAP